MPKIADQERSDIYEVYTVMLAALMFLFLVSFEAYIHTLTPNGLTKYLSSN